MLAAGRVTPQSDSLGGPKAVRLDRTDLRTWLDGLVPNALREGDLPGAIVVVVKDGRILVQKGYGWADVGRRVPMDAGRTVVSVGSVSKLFAWTAVMQQVAAGRLDLDRDVNEQSDVQVPAAFGAPITLRHLMTHTAGFEERAFRSYRHPRSLGDHLRGTPVPVRIFAPGTVIAYSNYGAMLAAHLVEQVSGEPFLDYVDRHVLGRLGMTRSSFRRPLPTALAADLAASYDEASGDPKSGDALDHEEPSGDPSGHLATTGTDIARFMLAHLGHGRLGDSVLLDSTTTALMHAPAFEPAPGAHPVTLGFFRADRNGRRILAHAGDIEGFHADLQLLPDDGVGFFLVLNGSGAPRGLFGAGHLFRTTLFRRFVDRYFPAAPGVEVPTVPTARAHSRLVAGEYQMSRRGMGDFVELETLFARMAMKLVLRANDDGTITTPPVLDFEQGRARTWREVGPFVWQEVGGTERLPMRVDDGRVVAWVPEHLFSFVLQPIAAAKGARLNVALMAFAFIVLVGAALLWLGSLMIAWRAGRGIRREWRATGVGALIGLVYLLGWAVIVGLDVPTREGGEVWIRAVQVVGLVALGATGLSIRGIALMVAAGRGPVAVSGAALVALAMLETVWLSFGFHLLSLRLIY